MGYDVYTVHEVMSKLRISKNIAYELIKEGLFPVIRIKGIYRIPKPPFDERLNNCHKVA